MDRILGYRQTPDMDCGSSPISFGLEEGIMLSDSLRKHLVAVAVLAGVVMFFISACAGGSDSGGVDTPVSGTSDTVPPSVPRDLTAEAISSSQIILAWTPSSDDVGVAGYRLIRDGATAGTTPETGFVDNGLEPGTSYGYQVCAFDSAGNESAASPGVTASTDEIVEGAILRVGPDREYHSLQDVASMLKPGDLVLVDGGNVYQGGIAFYNHGTPGAPITIRGVRDGSGRPVIEGGRNVVEFSGNNYIFEGFRIRNAEFRGMFHHADDITIRDCVVQGCPHGILGADQGSGDLLVEYCEVFNCGRGESGHQLYISTNEDDYPGSVFRLQFCYIHDSAGGENVKSRAERTEIYYNWLENPYYHNLELIGPDPAGGVAEDKAREDADVVGNVIISRRFGRNVRIGGDGTGQSFGRYRFVNNTFIHFNANASSQIFPHFDVESVEMHNNVFYLLSGTVLDDSEARWVFGRRVSGSNNWVRAGAGYPGEWTGTLTGVDPGMVDLGGGVLRPAPGSILIGAGISSTVSPEGSPFPEPLLLPLFHPPEAVLLVPGSGQERTTDGVIDIGAFEWK